ncbi:MAG: 1,4-dihydroxy-6-naphthoate synthase, partial [Thermodesulfobacteria bacterium]|nr:1,4-dihydroxy-6-naphthoate synthase [Thermodesulfobacteriota bacterium]
SIAPFVRRHAQELDEEVIRRHIETFVNRFTDDLGEEGRRAVRLLLEFAVDRGLIRTFPEDFIWEETP